ncbi:MAG: ABC transporter ATP-binding protein [Clostridium sp.]|uniref:ABC transporter ATP-binding protein n=1 Tax=Clostridium sp. TaxID=1506 RepID=UPI002904CB6A|nr:ABC transporter ATP-binding protein [Clostridium sp.]MDU1585890.1 ABC transporter ATP-binding protein [Clostridium sp.]
MNILEVNGLKKKYTTNYVVNGISFEVNKGEILVFLGPNGAGKSTTINILSTALRATEGKIKFMGKYISENKSSLGIVPQSLAIFENIPAIENVKYFASFYGIKGEELKRKSEEALDMVGLLDRAKDLPKTYSGGMKRRLNIACALAHGPKLLILDEPTVGIDPQSRNHILESIKTLRKRGATIIYTTHYMEEVEAICDRVLIMDRGLVIAEGTLKELKESMEESTVYNISGEGIENIEKTFFDSIEGVNNVEVKDSLIVSTRKDSNNLDKIILKLINEKVKIKNIVTEEQNLETIFLNLTGRNLRN